MKSILCLAAAAVVLPCAVPARAAAAKGFRWQREANSVALLKDGQVIWQFRYGKGESKPAFHPISFPGGPVMSCYRNEDHPWHRGLWFSWKFINGLNYWEEDKAGISEGVTENSNVKVETRRNFSARISLDLTYRPRTGEPVMTEKRVIEVSAPDGQGVYHLDWTMTFRAAGKDVLLDRTPIPGDPDGKAHGGYSGLAMRFDRDMTDIQVMSSNGPQSFPEKGYHGLRTKAAAADYSGTIGGKLAGMAFVDHPSNLNSPSPWWIIDQKAMKYFNPSVLCYGPHTIKAGQSMTLRYRGLVHPGRWDAARLTAEAERFAKASK